MFVNWKIVNVHLVECCATENGWRVRGPDGVNYLHWQVETHNLLTVFRIPNSNSPISTGTDEGSVVKIVPLDFIYGKQMASVSFLVLTTVGPGTLVNLALLGSD